MGMYNMVNHGNGWIVTTIGKNIQEPDFISIYITSIYWIITTFSSVGYGDIVGNTANENLYQMLVEMVGIGFFGYMVGTFQTLIQGFKQMD
jgi:potassium channel